MRTREIPGVFLSAADKVDDVHSVDQKSASLFQEGVIS